MIKEKVFNPKLAPDYQIILDATNDLIFAFDKNYQLAYSNKSFKKNFELFVNESLDDDKTLDEYLGLSRFIDFKSRWSDWFEKAFSGKRFTEIVEYKIIGKKLVYSLEFTPVLRENEVAYVQISAREETHRKNYENLLKKQKETVECPKCVANEKIDTDKIIQERDEALDLLMENAERLQIVFEGSNDGFWDWNIEKDEIFHSKQYYEMLGYRQGELKSDLNTWESRIHREDVEYVIESMEAHMEGKTDQFCCEYRVLTKNNEWKWVLDKGKVAIRDENNNPLRFAGMLSDIDDRVKAEKALRLTQYTVDKSAVAIYWYDLDAKFFYANKIAVEQLGYNHEEIYKMRLIDISPEVTEEYWQNIKECSFTESRIVKLESIHKRKNGEEFPVEVISSNISYEGETVFVAFVTDITERKKAESKLKESEERFVSMAENLPVMVWLTNNRIVPTFVNKQAIDFVGEDYCNKMLHDHVHAEDLEYYKSIIKSAIKTKKKHEFEVRLLDKNNEYRWVLSKIVPRYSVNDKLIGLLGVGLDITERKEIETKLLDSETQFTEITNVIGDGIFMIDANWQLKFANPEFTNLLGYDFEKLENINIHELIHYHDQSENSLCPLLQVYNSGETIRVPEDYFKMENGELLPVSYVVSPLNRKGEIVGCVVAFHDISARLEAENEMNRFVEELQFNKELMEENANEFARLNEKLAESESTLKESNASKDKFFSIISHDLRSPFTSIIGFAEVMLEDIDTLDKEDIKDFTGSIYKSSKNIQNLLENLLQWSRVQTGRIEFNPINFDLNNLANDVVALYQVNAARKKIVLSSGIENQYTIKADKFMIDTILRNLVSNSIKFTKQGGEITILAEEISDQGVLQISIEDTGIGMKEEVLNKLFKIDEHVTTKGTDKEKGTGLGLILCKEFIEKHGGTIWVESVLGEGSKFKFTVPYSVH